MRTTRERLIVLVGLAFGLAALWRFGVAVGHYRASLAIVNDQSIRELEEVNALVEFGIGALLLAHAAAAMYCARRSLQPRVGQVMVVGAVTGVLVAGSLLRVPVLDVLGLLPASLVLVCAYTGFFAREPWPSAYVGSVLGGIAGVFIGVPSADPFVMTAVVAPPVCYALLGVALGRMLSSRRR